ncbi:hypothetical protein P691DRAFT_832633 [Macrolepiota fuliginosa MF-IS2]|uniref:Uncharacterized protein n=1 Tax=Macrolepiota fuliginosa MF-IS2 TaxID=1400762 RepID=A0A9P6BZD6_9AGAR|nr:hypothetical protein P691DRAFT_832633 [Macrolepiota fuliginosa MF-IS2]
MSDITSASDRQLLLWENLDFISSTTISGVLYGIALVFYVLSAQSFCPQLKAPHREKHAIFMLAYTSAVMACGTICLVLSARQTQLAYINHNTFPGEPVRFKVECLPHLAIGLGRNISGTMVAILTVGIQIWRLWVIYSATRHALIVIILPLLLFLCFVGCLNLIIRYRTDYNAGTSETSKQYMSIVTMLIESCALESAWYLAALLLFLLNNVPVGVLVTNCNTNIQVITYILIIYRVSTGRGWDRQTERQISTLCFQGERSTRASPDPSDANAGYNSFSLTHSAV